MKFKLAILALLLFAAACSSNETTTAVDLDDVVETTITEEIDTPSVTTIPETTTPATTSVPKDTGHTHDEEGEHTNETVETTVPETTTTTATTAAPTGDTTATTAPPRKAPSGGISHIDNPEACRANPHACDDVYALPHIHILGKAQDGLGEQVINTDPNHTHLEYEPHNHEILKGLPAHPRIGSKSYVFWCCSGIGDAGNATVSSPLYTSEGNE